MKCGVVIFPGSNCDDDMLYLLGKALDRPVERLWHKDTDLKGCDFIILSLSIGNDTELITGKQ